MENQSEEQVVKDTDIESSVSRKWLKIRDECLKEDKLFEDPDFACDDSSIPEEHLGSTWLRPKEINKDAVFFLDGTSRFDVKQGGLGNCWFIAAVATLTLNKKLLHQVVPDDQSFEEKYAGVFHFRFWQFGRWREVIIDDRLPTKDGSLIYMRSSAQNEFWSALLEKAYAKLHGSYQAIGGGNGSEALVDFTGGLAEKYFLEANAPANLFQILLSAFKHGSLITCGINFKSKAEEDKTGLPGTHVYSVTGVARFHSAIPHGINVGLVRIRNPHGSYTEWTGAWNDRSKEWQSIPEDVKVKMGLTVKGDGEFWMAIDDFEKKFQDLEICNLTSSPKSQWEIQAFEGKWVPNVTIWSSIVSFFATYGQAYHIMLTDADDDDDKCTLIVGITQETVRGLPESYHLIGFEIFQINDGAGGTNLLKSKRGNHRHVTCRFNLSPGAYRIVPFAYLKSDETPYILQVYTEKKAEIEVEDESLAEGK